MKINVRKILALAYLLVFCLYSVSPIVVSVPTVGSLVPTSGDDDVFCARLSIFDVFADNNDNMDTSIASQEESKDIFLKKKRTITSKKNLLDAVPVSEHLSPKQRLLEHHTLPVDAPLPAHHLSFQYFASGVSPPSLS